MSDVKVSEERSRFRRIRIGVTVAAIAVVLFVSLVVLKPAMPDRITLLTGPEGSSYHDLGLRYASELEARGLDAEVLITAGGFDNLERLAAGTENAVAFAPSAIESVTAGDPSTSGLVSLGSVGFEPLWLFHRSELDVRKIQDLAGRVVATGGKGTVGDHVARRLIELNGITGEVEIRSPDDWSAESVVGRIEAGSIDAVFLTGLPESTIVSALLGSEHVSFLSFDRAAAYAARLQGVTTVGLPEGVIDLARNIPSSEAQLLSASTGLVALDSLHPSVAPMVLSAASDVHEQKTFFSSATTFPSADNISLPLDPSAKRWFDQGQKGLSKFLPYKVTRFLNHLGFVVLPLLTVMVVLLKLAPVALRIIGSARLVGLLKRLEAVEKAHAAGADRSSLLADLDRIDENSAKMFVPRAKVHDYIDFRQFLHDMRERVERRDGE